MSETFLELLEKKIIVFDGATGTHLQGQNLSADDFGGEHLNGCNEYLVVSKPSAVENVHRDYLEAGADVVETNSFGGTSIVLAEYGLAPMAYELNLKAARIARSVADAFTTPGRPRFVAGSMGPTTKLPSLGHCTFADMSAAYGEQTKGLLDGGVDLLCVETCQDLLQAKAALCGIFDCFAGAHRRVPVIVSVTVESTGTLLLGTEIGAALVALEPFDIDVLGMNCATGPKEMSDHIRTLCASSPKPVFVMPNAGIPENIGGHAHYHLSPEELVRYLSHFVKDLGVSVVGGCCGTTQEHIRQLAAAVGGLAPKHREIDFVPSASSLYQAVPLHIDPPPVLVGERTNANGSKQFRDLLAAEDWEGIVAMGRGAVKEGAHMVDVCAAYVGRDEAKDMREIIRRFNTQVTLPLVIDSTEAPVIEEALRLIAGKAVINSINMEDGEERIRKVVPLCKKYGAAVIALTIDEQGMAKTADRKLEIAKRIYELVVHRYGMKPHDLIFDTLTFTLGSGEEEFRRAGMETIEGIRRIKRELPGVKTLLGVSNISFGLSPGVRHPLNSVFLHSAIEAGLDMAIVHAARIMPLYKIDEKGRALCAELIADARRYEEVMEGGVPHRKVTYDPLTELMALYAGTTREKTAGAPRGGTIEERLKTRIIDGDRAGLQQDLDEGLKAHSALDIINTILLDGMKVVGELFGSGQMQLPFVLQSAEVMKASVAYLEQFMSKADTTSRGVMVLATVRGDVHDIGKNLVDIILTNNGYRVVNLGIKVPIDAMLQAAEEHRADAIGMSGLLVKSTLIMKENLGVMNERGITLPVILGGAALTRRYVEQDLRGVYGGPVMYANDAFDGLKYMAEIASAKSAPASTSKSTEMAPQDAPPAVSPMASTMAPSLAPQDAPPALAPAPTAAVPAAEEDDAERLTGTEAKIALAEKEYPRQANQAEVAAAVAGPARSRVRRDIPVPVPPFFGSKVVENLSLEEVYPYVNEVALIRGQWQVRKGKMTDETYRAMVQEKIMPDYEALKGRILREGLLRPAVVYGYFPCQSDGDDLIVYDEGGRTERARFTFPRQRGDRHLCLSDFFSPADSGRLDVVAFQLVTMGKRASEESARLFASGNYRDYLYFHGLSVECAEALAELWHKRIREELGIASNDAREVRRLFSQGYQGSRYSFGYPACPDLEDQSKLFDLLDAGRIGVRLTDEFSLDPEQSTNAIIVHHPEARYFTVV
jgi:5-methyltetrahydrofolate--homocysteine methyltransferase